MCSADLFLLYIKACNPHKSGFHHPLEGMMGYLLPFFFFEEWSLDMFSLEGVLSPFSTSIHLTDLCISWFQHPINFSLKEMQQYLVCCGQECVCPYQISITLWREIPSNIYLNFILLCVSLFHLWFFCVLSMVCIGSKRRKLARVIHSYFR